MSYGVTIQGVTKKYGDFTAVNEVSLEIKEGELFTLLGPSGCGKTTLLRMIAGFNTIEGGTILFGDKVINHVPAHKRDIGMVFQSYAIFPHMTVAENIAYGLKAKKVSKEEIKEKVEKALKLVQIENLKDRKPSELSGGQQQRVALARAIVIEPGILLMDEPLSNLDAKLRVQMRSTIRKLQKDLGITTIYVTHDQEEALAISDKIAVMKDGQIIQIGTPEEIYKNPQTTFVAGFIGTSHFIKCYVKVTSKEGELLKGEVRLGENYVLDVMLKKPYYEGETMLSIRPGQVKIGKESIGGEESIGGKEGIEDKEGIKGKEAIKGKQGMKGTIGLATFLGDYIAYEVVLESKEVIEVHESIYEASKVYQEGESVLLSFDASCVRVYHPVTQEVISC